MDIATYLFTKAMAEGGLQLNTGVDGRVVLQAKVGTTWVTVSSVYLDRDRQAAAEAAERQAAERRAAAPAPVPAPVRKRPTLELVQ